MSTNYLLPQNIDELLNRFEELQSDIFDRLNLVSKKIGTLSITLKEGTIVSQRFNSIIGVVIGTIF